MDGKLVRFESRTFHDLVKWASGVKQHLIKKLAHFLCDSNHLVSLIRVKKAHASSQV